MRLRWGPHASQSAGQVVLRDPWYVVQILATQPQGVLADVLETWSGGSTPSRSSSPARAADESPTASAPIRDRLF